MYIYRSKLLCDILRLKSCCSPVNLAGNALWLVCSLWRGQECQGSQAGKIGKDRWFFKVFEMCIKGSSSSVCLMIFL